MMMDCRTASLLIEAYHDDELELVDAAHLLAHLEECPPCRDRCEEAGKLRETLKTCRPVDRCPEELARRLAQRLDVRSRRRRTFPRSVTIVVAAGCGIAVGWAAVRLRVLPVSGVALANPVQKVEGEFVCLRCAMGHGLTGSRLEGTPHRPLLLTSDGRLFVVRAESPASARLEVHGPARRHVAVMARLDDSSGTANVMELLSEPAAGTSAASASSAVAR